VHHDGLGSVRALTDETGTTTDTKAYEAFGGVVASAGTDPLPYGFAGEAFDGTSGLAYHRARWMDPRVGRFVGMDPLSNQPDSPIHIHQYEYAEDEPLSRRDPTGLDPDGGAVYSLNLLTPIFVGTAAAMGRPITSDETTFLDSIYGGALATGDIRLHSLGIAGFIAPGISPWFNDIYLRGEYYRDPQLDLGNVRVAGLFAHESFHLWQRQHGRWVSTEGLAAHAVEFPLSFTDWRIDLYSYDPHDVYMEFLQGGIEQQAEIIEDYVTARQRGWSTTQFEAVMSFVRGG
jgi:RHS repeat-associated protein